MRMGDLFEISYLVLIWAALLVTTTFSKVAS